MGGPTERKTLIPYIINLANEGKRQQITIFSYLKNGSLTEETNRPYPDFFLKYVCICLHVFLFIKQQTNIYMTMPGNEEFLNKRLVMEFINIGSQNMIL